MNRINVEFQKAGVRGLTFLFASGDDGADCKIQNSVPSIRLQLHMSPPFWGTGLNDPFTLPAEYGHEISGGGFRNVFPRPSYQNDVVERYLKSGPHIPPISYFNPNGRGFPDISAVCYYFWTRDSCSGPLKTCTLKLCMVYRLLLQQWLASFHC